MKRILTYNWLPLFFAVMTTFSFTACGSDDDDNETPSIERNATTSATIIGKWKVMTFNENGLQDGTYKIHCFNADGTGYSQQFNPDGTSGGKDPITYTFDGNSIYVYDEDGDIEDVLYNVKITATTLTATSITGFTATMTRISDDDNSGNDNSGNGNDDNTNATPSVTAGTAIDLGLSVKWASCNVGAKNPWEYGGYYAWGETEEKSYYSWNTYKYCNGSDNNLTKYCTNSSYGIVDNKTTLEASDDVATVKCGSSWRMPTEAEQKELRNNCTWEQTTLNNVNGYRITGPNGNSIFLPAAGHRYGNIIELQGSWSSYWSKSLSKNSEKAYYLYLDSPGGSYYRYIGHSVRPVCK